MTKLIQTLIAVAALSLATTTTYAQAQSSVEFKKNTFLGMLNPKSWDGPYWWGLNSAVDNLAVSHVSGREVRSDRAGVRAFVISLRLTNLGDSVAGKKSLSLRGADRAADDRVFSVLRELNPSPQPWSIGKGSSVPALAPGAAAELSIVVYQNDSRLVDAQESLLELEVSAE
jgi:hypothetical protein